MQDSFARRKAAYIDLSNGRIEARQIPEDARLMLLGGRGVNMLALLKYAPPDLGAISADAPLIVGNGFLSGIPGLCLARTSISGISPESGLLGDSNVGGHFCAAMRRTSFDLLVITGEFEGPGIIVIDGDSVSFEDGVWLWGKDAFEAHDALKSRFGADAESLVIGPAGENLIRFSQVRAEGRHAASRTGLGCVMGAKRIKAIVARGMKRDMMTDLFDRDVFARLTRRLRKVVSSIDVIKHLAKRGTPFLYDVHSRMGLVRTKNATSGPLEKGNALRSSRLLQRYYVGRSGCFSCPVRCQHSYRIPDGKYAGIKGPGIEYGTLGTIGPVLGIADLDAVLAINHKLNRLGIDSCTTGNLIAAAIELFQSGVITEKDTGGLRLSWGDADLVIQLADLIARREGFGALLADGASAFCERFGEAARDAMIWSKRLPQSDPVDVRGHKGFALGVATATRGADHLRSRPTLEALNLSGERLREMFGVEVSPDPASYVGKAEMVRRSESLFAVSDAIGICRFVVKFNSPDLLGFSELAEYIQAATGLDLSPANLEIIGQRINTIERLWLATRTNGEKLDGLPKRYSAPMPAGRFKGQRIEQQEFQAALSRFHQISGLDPATGAPLESTLQELGIDDSLLELV